MKLLGLTGGIASGKSTVAAILRRLGAAIINADELSREVVQPGQDAWIDRKVKVPSPSPPATFANL